MKKLDIKIAAIGLFIIFFSIYFISSPPQNTPFNHFTRLADSLLHGHLWIPQELTYLEAAIGPDGRRFVPYPPMPALLSLPFVFVFGVNFPQQYIAHLLGAVSIVLLMLTTLKIKNDIKTALWIGLLAGLGTIIYFLSSVGSSWYLGQLSAFFFFSCALLESFSKKRPFLIGLFLGAAYLSRLHTILSLPFFLYLLHDHQPKHFIRNLVAVCLGILPFIAINSAYNFLRFGVFWDKAYTLIPGLYNEPWFNRGLVSIEYIPRSLSVAFGALPVVINKPPFVLPSLNGLAIWITTPAFIYALWASLKDAANRFAWAVILLISLVVFMHGGWGFSQFGYRYAVDFYPFLIFLIIKSVSKTGITWHHWLLLALSILVNLWGVVWINKFNWVLP